MWVEGFQHGAYGFLDDGVVVDWLDVEVVDYGLGGAELLVGRDLRLLSLCGRKE